jgi:hypothetical protein
MEDYQLVALAIAGVWAGFGSAMGVIYRLNETRDRLLDWSAPGAELSTDPKRWLQEKLFVFWWDYVAVWISILVFIVIFTLALILFAWKAFSFGWLAGCICLIGVLFGVLGLVIQIWAGTQTIKLMRARIRDGPPPK